VDEIVRLPSGKPDYQWAKSYAQDHETASLPG
jgi:hypothetical protein